MDPMIQNKYNLHPRQPAEWMNIPLLSLTCRRQVDRAVCLALNSGWHSKIASTLKRKKGETRRPVTLITHPLDTDFAGRVTVHKRWKWAKKVRWERDRMTVVCVQSFRKKARHYREPGGNGRKTGPSDLDLGSRYPCRNLSLRRRGHRSILPSF